MASDALAVRSDGPLAPDDLARLGALRGAAMPQNTRVTYRRYWLRFAEWCKARRRSALPASPATLAAFIALLASEGKRLSTVKVAVSAINAAHHARRLPSPRYDVLVTETLRGFARLQAGRPSEAMIAMTPEILAKLCAAQPQTLRGVRNRALLLVGWCSALRKSELVALEVSDVTWKPEGATILVRRSKTDQEGVGALVPIYRSDRLAMCPVRWLRHWLKVARISEGPIFRSFNNHGVLQAEAMHREYVGVVIREAEQLAGIEHIERLGAHSLRAGFITAAAKKGQPLHVIAQTSRHKSLEILRGYIRDEEAMQNGAGKGLLDDVGAPAKAGGAK